MDSFPSLRIVRISPLVPLVLFVFVFLFKLFVQIRQKRHIRLPRLKVNRSFIAVVILVLLAAGFRIPFLVHNFGLYTSDHAVSALMAKHISEGKLPPVYFYGQLYSGSLSEHFFALLFLLFGYSVFLLKLSTLLFYLAFMAVQFLLIRKIFSFDFAVLVSLFYCLPIGHLVTVSFFNTSPFSLTLLFGALALYMTYLICYKNKPALIPPLGFLMGLSFWTYQISIAFILTSLFILVWKYRFDLKRYIVLFVFALLGSLPFWVHEIQEGLSLAKFLVPGEGKILLGARIQRTLDFIRELFFLKKTPLDSILLVLVFLGFVVLIFLSFKKRSLVPQSLFSVFFVFFLVMYITSDFSDKDVVRYLYPLYFCLPVLLLSIFSFVKARVKYLVIFFLFLSLFLFGNLREQIWSFQITRGTDRMLRGVIQTIKKTGNIYWQGEYWTAYLLTALSEEKTIVDSLTQNRYFPYSLDYYNQGENNNFIFLRRKGSYEAGMAERLVHLLDALDVGYKKKEIGDALLVYDVGSTVFPPVFDLESAVPPRLPDMDLTQIRNSDGHLLLTFKNNEPVEDLHLMAHVEIPDFSSTSLAFSWNKEEIRIKIPFPQKESFKIRCYFDYKGLKIPSTEKEWVYTLPDEKGQKRRQDVVPLSGVGPIVNYKGKTLRICEKEVNLEINKELSGDSQVQLYLYSPFQFHHPYWYGEYCQRVRVAVNKNFLEEFQLEDGANRIDIALRDKCLKEGSNILTLRLKYHMPFAFFKRRKTAALLDRIEIH
jgi:hypothetical protein